MTINKNTIPSSLELLAKQVVEGFITGLHKSPYHGFSVEFAEHRLYNKGESTKHIDWKLYGRTDKLFVKRYEEETNLRCQIVIDKSSSMYFPLSDGKSDGKSKIKFSVECAAALIELLRRQRDAFGLTLFSDSVEFHSQAKSTTLHRQLLYDELEGLLKAYNENEHKKTAAVEALHQLSEAIHKRSLVVIFSDMMESVKESDEIFAALQHLKHKKHEVILFHVVDKQKELDFSFENRPYRFLDMETGEEVKLNPLEVKDFYKEAIQKYTKELKLKCGQYNIDFVEADINSSYDQILIPYLLRRKKTL